MRKSEQGGQGRPCRKREGRGYTNDWFPGPIPTFPRSAPLWGPRGEDIAILKPATLQPWGIVRMMLGDHLVALGLHMNSCSTN